MAVAFIALGLALVSALYAALLNRKGIREWYTPDRTWVTVVIGDGLIIGALLCLVPFGVLALWQWGIVLGYTCVAGAPIIIWQRIRAKTRQRRAAQALERE
jgi:hypothetical protein